MKQKLLINCKIGDPVYIVNTKSKSDSGIPDCIRQYFIKDIIHHGNGIFTAGTTYKLEKISLHYTDKYEFNHSSSIDDELIVDSDHGYGKDGNRIYTTYQGALDYLISDIKCDILKQLHRLEYIEEHLGTSDNSSIVIRTKKMEYNWHKINKREIYEDIYSDDANKDIQEINEKLKNQKIEVWKIMQNMIGKAKPYIHQKKNISIKLLIHWKKQKNGYGRMINPEVYAEKIMTYMKGIIIT